MKTAALISNEIKRGLHRCHVAIVKKDTVRTFSVYLSKGSRDRWEEDAVCSRLILDAIAWASRAPRFPRPFLLSPDESIASEGDQPIEVIVEKDVTMGGDVLDRLLLGTTTSAMFVATNGAASSSFQASPLEAFSYLEDVALPSDTFVYPGQLIFILQTFS